MNIGKYKAILDRQLNYASRLNFIMIGYLFFKDVGFSWWYLSVIPVVIIWMYIDIRYIMPREFDYINRKSPFFRKLMQNTER